MRFVLAIVVATSLCCALILPALVGGEPVTDARAVAQTSSVIIAGFAVSPIPIQIPIPAPLSLLIGALAGVGFLSRRRRG